MKYSIVLSNNERSYTYIKLFLDNGLLPDDVIYLDNRKNKIIKKRIVNMIKTYKKINFKIFNSNSLDGKEVKKYLLNLKQKIFVYSGYPGEIIRSSSIFNNKVLLHSHSGKLPEYKGSTTIFYSILKEKKIFCSTFVMSPSIDKGKSLLINRYLVPKNLRSLDKYDYKIRAINTLKTLKTLKKLLKKPIKKKDIYAPYYIMHPILRYLALSQNI